MSCSSIALRDCNRVGLLPGHRGIAPIVRPDIRATLPVCEAIIASGGRCEVQSDGRYTITLGRTLPDGIVARVARGTVYLRLADEPDWGDYVGASLYDDHWVQLDWTPCPKCGAPLVWYEAGYVPGYRVCARKPHHHWIG